MPRPQSATVFATLNLVFGGLAVLGLLSTAMMIAGGSFDPTSFGPNTDGSRYSSPYDSNPVLGAMQGPGPAATC